MLTLPVIRLALPRLLLVLLAVYLPYAWLLWIDYPWNSYRWSWIKIWPLLPGIVGSAFLGRGFVGFTLTGLFWLAVIFGVTRLWVRQHRWRQPVLGALFLFSCAVSWVAYQLFLD